MQPEAEPSFKPLTQVPVPLGGTGQVSGAPPTFLERWGVVFLACSGIWVLLFAGILLAYYLLHLPSMPSEAGLNGDQFKVALDQHRVLLEQYRDSVGFVFDLMVTRTVLPLITLLLGYLFGKTRSV